MSASNDPLARDQMFLTALTTEHFGLQAAASTTVSEASSRASLYMFTLSSALVATGFSARTDAFVPLVATVLPVVVVLGVFTVVRLVDTGVQNVQVLAGIARIRAHYRTLSPGGAAFFPEMGGDVAAAGLAVMGLRRRRLVALFTAASMVSAINSVVAGVGVALWVTRLAPRPVGDRSRRAGWCPVRRCVPRLPGPPLPRARSATSNGRGSHGTRQRDRREWGCRLMAMPQPNDGVDRWTPRGEEAVLVLQAVASAPRPTNEGVFI